MGVSDVLYDELKDGSVLFDRSKDSLAEENVVGVSRSGSTSKSLLKLLWSKGVVDEMEPRLENPE